MGKASVLIAEDNADTRSLLHLLLENEGFEVFEAEDGASALQFLTRHHPDAIVTDLMMPLVGGIGLIQRLRRRAEFADTPIIAISAFAREYSPDPIMAGATAVLRKPEDLLQVAETLNRLLNL